MSREKKQKITMKRIHSNHNKHNKNRKLKWKIVFFSHKENDLNNHFQKASRNIYSTKITLSIIKNVLKM